MQRLSVSGRRPRKPERAFGATPLVTLCAFADRRTSSRASWRTPPRAFAGPLAPRSSPRLRARRGCLVRAAAADAAVGANADFGPDNRIRFAPPSSTRKTAPPGAPPIVILPGFGNNTKDYVNPFGDPDVSLVASLRARGWDVHVVDLERKDWAKILRAVFSLGFWRGDGTTEPGYTWYLERVDATVRAALAANPGATAVDLVAHSAGGWLARAYIGGALNEVRWDRFRYVARDPEPAPPPKYAVPHPNVRRLVTLGTPQRVASGPDANDATRGARFDGSTSGGPERRSPRMAFDTRKGA